jgi:cytidine deaminase
VSGSRKDVLAGTQVLNVIEYGRAVHAEMAAITDAARRGVSIQGSTLYCTTFPCHLCAKHIIAAGIKRVVYIEPYPKSAAAVLFKDSMVVDPEMPVVERVSFESFVGIAPSVYSFMFRVGDTRKTADGIAAKWEADDQCEPRFTRFVLSYLLIEDLVTAQQIPATFVGEYAIMGAPPGSTSDAR